jgi:nucleotide-binding universal stress UspA family protein
MKPIKILVPVDFSPCAMNALKSAVQIAKRMNGSITLFYVRQEMMLHEGDESHFEDDLIDDELKSKFQDLIDANLDMKNIPHQVMAKLGEVEEQVADAAKEVEADLIVMGTKGSSGIYEVLMGSNTYAVVRSSKVPVLVIPDGTITDEIRHIALAGDYKPIQPEMLEPVKLMAGIDGADIHIVHVDDDKSLTEEEMEEARKYKRYLKNFRHHYHLIEGDDFENALNDYCIEKDIDMISMIPRKHELFDRVFEGGETQNMVYHTKIPLLAIPE